MAIGFYLRSSLKKIFSTLKERHESRIDMLAIAYQRFLEGITSQKAERITNYFRGKVLLKLKINRELRLGKKQEMMQQCCAFQRAKTKMLFCQWSKIAKLEKSQRSFYKKRRDILSKELLQLLKENLDRKIMKKLSVYGEGISQFYAKKIICKAFQAFVINIKTAKLQKYLRVHQFPQVLKKIKGFNNNSKKCIQNRWKYLKANCFQIWKNEYKMKKAEVFHEKRVMNIVFLRWSSILNVLISENEIEKENAKIVSLFRDRCVNAKLERIFSRWHRIAQQAKLWRRENEILNRCAQAKYIQILLRRYFQRLKSFRLLSKIQCNYYEVRLKQKALDSFKILLISSAEREGKLFAFLQRRTFSKYFSRIKRFNREQNQKISKFKKQRVFRAFTFTIVYGYFLNKRKADTYYSQNLLFKSLFAFKNQRSLRIKEELCILTINMALPLRRWYKKYQIRNYIFRKNWLRSKAIIRQWRLLIILRHSNEQLVRQFEVEESGRKPVQDDTFEFQNILATIAKIRHSFMLQKSANDPNPVKAQ